MGGRPYGLTDLADDAALLCDRLGLGTAHVAGLAMGGTAAQMMVLRHPDRVTSLTLIGCGTSSGSQPAPDPRVRAMNREPIPDDEEARRHQRCRLFESMAGTCFDTAEYARADEESRQRGARTADASAQLRAMRDAVDRTGALARVMAPALVIVGAADPLVGPEAARELAEALPRGRLILMEGMGHGSIPRAVQAPLVTAMTAIARAA